MSEITPIGKPCRISKTIPAAFDESVSYLEMLSGILKKQNELIKQVNSNTSFIEGWSESLEELKARMDAVEAEFEEFKTEVNTLISDEEARIEQSMKAQIDAAEIRLDAKVNTQVARLDARIDNVAVGQINVIDPTTGISTPLQTTLYNMYEGTRDEALTATEYDELSLTATAYEAYQLTAIEYDRKGKTLLV